MCRVDVVARHDAVLEVRCLWHGWRERPGDTTLARLVELADNHYGSVEK